MEGKEDIINYCKNKINEEKRITMIIENPFADKIYWCSEFRYIYINFPEEKLPDLALHYNSLENKLEVYYDGEFHELEEYLNRKVYID